MKFKGFSFDFITNMITYQILTEFFYITFFNFLFNYILHFLSDNFCLWSRCIGGLSHLLAFSVGVTDAEESDHETVLGFAVDKGLD